MKWVMAAQEFWAGEVCFGFGHSFVRLFAVIESISSLCKGVTDRVTSVTKRKKAVEFSFFRCLGTLSVVLGSSLQIGAEVVRSFVAGNQAIN